MANRPAPALVLREGDRSELERLTRSSSVRAGLAQQARIVLLAAEGITNTEIAARCSVIRQTVVTWRSRYLAGGLAGLDDEARSGRPRTIDPARIITETLKPRPKNLGVTHWSTRLLGDRLKVANSTIAKAWRAYGLQPWPTGSFRFSTDPMLEAKVVDVVGLYLTRPRTRSYSAWTRNPRSRPWSGPRRSCRCSRTCSNAAPMTIAGTGPRPCSRR
jgi:transposase